jgi:hypothetical protein
MSKDHWDRILRVLRRLVTAQEEAEYDALIGVATPFLQLRDQRDVVALHPRGVVSGNCFYEAIDPHTLSWALGANRGGFRAVKSANTATVKQNSEKAVALVNSSLVRRTMIHNVLAAIGPHYAPPKSHGLPESMWEWARALGDDDDIADGDGDAIWKSLLHEVKDEAGYANDIVLHVDAELCGTLQVVTVPARAIARATTGITTIAGWNGELKSMFEGDKPAIPPPAGLLEWMKQHHRDKWLPIGLYRHHYYSPCPNYEEITEVTLNHYYFLGKLYN